MVYNVPTGIMDDLFNYSTNVTVTFRKVEITQTCRLFVVMGVRFELEGQIMFECLFFLWDLKERRTIACERLCVLMTRPIVVSKQRY